MTAAALSGVTPKSPTPAALQAITDRFVRYAAIGTPADETSRSAPSSECQWELARLLADECRALGLADVELSPQALVTATLPANVTPAGPAMAWVAHVDTSPEFQGRVVRPLAHPQYAGGDLVLPADPARVIRVADNPALAQCRGFTVITADGTSLLGADDKSGIAAIMAATEHLLAHPEIPRCPIRLCFTTDEEIGRGTAHIDLRQLNCVVGYTLDSEGYGRIDTETFSADAVEVAVHGINTHPSEGFGRMVNSLRIMGEFLAALPQDALAPEVTRGREGFIHPYHVEGGVEAARARLILRDFETAALDDQHRRLEEIADTLRQKYPRASITLTRRTQYRNMRDGLAREPRAVAKAIEATRAAGLEPNLQIIRGGTDGSLLTALGLPTPNLSSGQHNPHTPLEWTSDIEMWHAAMVLVELAKAWSSEHA